MPFLEKVQFLGYFTYNSAGKSSEPVNFSGVEIWKFY